MKKFYDTFLEPRGGSTANNKLSPVTVYVPVSVNDELPKFGEGVFVFQYPNQPSMSGVVKAVNKRVDLSGSTFEKYDPNRTQKIKQNNDFADTGRPETWLKEQEKFILTNEELKGLLANTFNAGVKYQKDYIMYLERGVNFETPNQKEYIQSLF